MEKGLPAFCVMETVHVLRLTEAIAACHREGGEEMRLNERQDQSLTAPAKVGRPVPLHRLCETYQNDSERLTWGLTI